MTVSCLSSLILRWNSTPITCYDAKVLEIGMFELLFLFKKL